MLVCVFHQVLRSVAKVFGICFIEGYCPMKTVLVYLKWNKAERIIKQLHILILKIKPEKLVQTPLKCSRCFINIYLMNDWPLKSRIKRLCQCKRFLRKCTGCHFPHPVASNHELAFQVPAPPHTPSSLLKVSNRKHCQEHSWTKLSKLSYPRQWQSLKMRSTIKVLNNSIN